MLPLTINSSGERVSLYPEMEDELARSSMMVEGEPSVIVVEERSGKPYRERRMSGIHRKIYEEAGLPKDMTFTGFRYGGITEVGVVDADVRPISSHATLDVTRICNNATAEKARQIAAAHRAHIALVAGEMSERTSE